MASRSQSWFDDEKLFPGEQRVRNGRVRIRTADPPHWWEGTLILTTDRMFFLPDVDNPLLGNTAFWLAEIRRVEQVAPNRIRIRGGDVNATFQLLGRHLPLPGQRTIRPWIESIEAVRSSARASEAFRLRRRRAAG
jgi:hypothetical protein